MLYAGNVGFSQSLEMVVDSCRERCPIGDVPDQRRRRGAPVVAATRPMAWPTCASPAISPSDRLPEVLATGDIHLVPLKRGLGRVSVPSKTYSILAAGRPVLAAIDPGTEVPRILAESGGGVGGAARRPGGLPRRAAATCSTTRRGRSEMGLRGPAMGGAAPPRRLRSPRAYADLIVELNHRRVTQF